MISKRARTWLRRGATIALVLFLLVTVVGMWITTEQIDATLLEVEGDLPEYDLEVLDLDEEAVTLPRTVETLRPGLWGLEWEAGYAQIGEIVDEDAASVTRRLIESSGALEEGDLARLDRFVYESDPGDLGIAFRTVVIEGPLGDYPAWRIDGTDDTWVIFVHGRGDSRREALRLLPTVVDLDFPSLVITYRNDPPAPESPNRRHSLGKHEWTDLEAAVEYAIVAGATDVVLAGYGMGGAITSTFVRESDWGPRVGAMLLDAPLLDGGIVVDDEAAEKDVPGFIVALAKGLASLRYGVDWGGLDQIRHVDELEIPILLFHGDADEEVPVRSSDLFVEAAAEAEQLVRYERVEGAGHGEAWNVARARYEAAVRTFLTATVRGASDLDPIGDDVLEDLQVEPGDGVGES